MKFRAKVIPSGNATAVEIPTDVVKALDSGPRPRTPSNKSLLLPGACHSRTK